MIISIATQHIYSKFGTDYFVSVKLNPHLCLYLSVCIKKNVPSVKTSEAEYSRNNKGYYYEDMQSVWKNTTVIKWRKVMYIIDQFMIETPEGNPYGKTDFSLFFALDQITKKSLVIW